MFRKTLGCPSRSSPPSQEKTALSTSIISGGFISNYLLYVFNLTKVVAIIITGS